MIGDFDGYRDRWETRDPNGRKAHAKREMERLSFGKRHDAHSGQPDASGEAKTAAPYLTRHDAFFGLGEPQDRAQVFGGTRWTVGDDARGIGGDD